MNKEQKEQQIKGFLQVSQISRKTSCGDDIPYKVWFEDTDLKQDLLKYYDKLFPEGRISVPKTIIKYKELNKPREYEKSLLEWVRFLLIISEWEYQDEVELSRVVCTSSEYEDILSEWRASIHIADYIKYSLSLFQNQIEITLHDIPKENYTRYFDGDWEDVLIYPQAYMEWVPSKYGRGFGDNIHGSMLTSYLVKDFGCSVKLNFLLKNYNQTGTTSISLAHYPIIN